MTQPLDIYSGEMEIMFTQNLPMKAHNLFIPSSPKLETRRCPLHRLLSIQSLEYSSTTKGARCWPRQQLGWISREFAEWKEAFPKVYWLCYSTCMTSLKWQNDRNTGQSSGCLESETGWELKGEGGFDYERVTGEILWWRSSAVPWLVVDTQACTSDTTAA